MGGSKFGQKGDKKTREITFLLAKSEKNPFLAFFDPF